MMRLSRDTLAYEISRSMDDWGAGPAVVLCSRSVDVMTSCSTTFTFTQEQTWQIGALIWAGKQWGMPANGLPVLALHGWLDHAGSFDALMPQLPGLSVLAVDLPGHGLSSWRPSRTYHFMDYVADTAVLLNHLQWREFALVGHSLGANVAAMLAGLWPERVKKLVLLDGLGPRVDEAEVGPMQMEKSVERETALWTDARSQRLYPDADEVLSRIQAAVGITKCAARLWFSRGVAQEQSGYRFRADPALRLPSRLRMTEEQVAAFLRRIACPTLYVRPRANSAPPQNHESTRMGHIAGLQVVEVQGSHHVHLEQPELLMPELVNFLVS